MFFILFFTTFLADSELKLIALETSLKLKEGEKKMAEMDAQILLTKEKVIIFSFIIY